MRTACIGRPCTCCMHGPAAFLSPDAKHCHRRMLEGRATHVETASMGTPTHAAPELLRSGHLSPAVDAFAFGVLGEWVGA